jgi:hypothetical protein
MADLDAAEPGLTPVWRRRALTLALFFAYAPGFVAAPFIVEDALRRIAHWQEFALLSLYTLASFAALGAAFIALTLPSRFVQLKARRRLFVFLLAYWLPHTLLVLLWAFLGALDHPSAWID